ncbi:hypothetical protein [Paenibacillus harenae]|uniref:hypothetical protein n=1 Tax=Paenibacillus harenae TaxID=306543 RepID=UPI00041DDDA8|nr:hypothetical protein [Paenibacillus harenae]
MAKALPDRIETYEQYEELLARLVDGAKKLSNPLLDDDVREKMMAVYDRIDGLLGDYSERVYRQ